MVTQFTRRLDWYDRPQWLGSLERNRRARPGVLGRRESTRCLDIMSQQSRCVLSI